MYVTKGVAFLLVDLMFGGTSAANCLLVVGLETQLLINRIKKFCVFKDILLACLFACVGLLVCCLFDACLMLV